MKNIHQNSDNNVLLEVLYRRYLSVLVTRFFVGAIFYIKLVTALLVLIMITRHQHLLVLMMLKLLATFYEFAPTSMPPYVIINATIQCDILMNYKFSFRMLLTVFRVIKFVTLSFSVTKMYFLSKLVITVSLLCMYCLYHLC